MTLTRRSLLAAGAAAATAGPRRSRARPAGWSIGLSSYPPSFAPFANAGSASAAAKLMVHRGLLGYGPDGKLRGELAQSWSRDRPTALGCSICAMRCSTTATRSRPPTSNGRSSRSPPRTPPPICASSSRKSSKIDVPDARRCGCHTKSPNVTLPLLFAGFYLPMVQKGSLADNPIGIGAGPFVMTAPGARRRAGVRRVRQILRPGLPKLKTRCAWSPMPTRTLRVAALQAGDVDLIEYVPWQSMGSIEANPS